MTGLAIQSADFPENANGVLEFDIDDTTKKPVIMFIQNTRSNALRLLKAPSQM